jgi:carbonic anhydrase
MIARFRFAAMAVLLLTSPLVAGGADPVPSRPTAREALGQLKAGNDRFARNGSKPVSLSVNRRKEIAENQRPFAMVLSCADARVPPEHIFNTGLGDLYVIRTAGQVIDRSILGTIEYGAENLHIPLLVVMGHESCDVVRAASEIKGPAESPNADFLMKAIQAARRQTPEDREEIKSLVLSNVEQVINDAIARSPRLRKLVDDGSLGIVGAYYELVSGRVVFSEPVPPGAAVNQTAHR